MLYKYLFYNLYIILVLFKIISKKKNDYDPTYTYIK